MPRLRLVIALAAIALLASCVERDASAVLQIEYWHEEAAVEFSYQVTCMGGVSLVEPEIDGIDAFLACESLSNSSIRNRLVDGPSEDESCTLEDFGDRAQITGHLGDLAIATTASRAGGCAEQDWMDLQAFLPTPVED